MLMYRKSYLIPMLIKCILCLCNQLLFELSLNHFNMLLFKYVDTTCRWLLQVKRSIQILSRNTKIKQFLEDWSLLRASSKPPPGFEKFFPKDKDGTAKDAKGIRWVL